MGSGAEALGAARRGNRRRLLVFGTVFGLCVAAGMAWNLLRPSVYRAVARIQLTVPSTAARSEATLAAAGPAEFLALVQTIDSVPALEEVSAALAAKGSVPGDPDSGDGVAALRRMIDVQPVAGTDLVQIIASGADPAPLAPAIEHLLAAFRRQLGARYERDNETSLTALRDELARLERTATERRGQLERFRSRAGIVSTEREEALSIARHRGLTTALNNAVEKQAAAEARVSALQAAASGVPGAGRSRDDPTLAAQESRASQIREELRDMERTYTPAFMAMDPRAIALRARLAELQRQIAQQRSTNQQAALAAAHEDAETARTTAERLRVQLQGEQAGLRSFSAGFAGAKQLEDDLAQVERARRDTLERLARLEASQRSRVPRLTVLEAAQPPTQPHAPDRVRDGLLVVGASFVAGLLAMAFVELFNRAPVAPAGTTTTLVLPQPMAMGLGHERVLTMDATTSPHALLAPAPGLLADAPTPRELSQSEVEALVAAAQGPGRLACAATLLGLTAAEAASARIGDIDPAAGVLKVGGDAPRTVPAPRWFLDLAAGAGTDAATPLLCDPSGRPWQPADVDLAIACAAVDAGLSRPSQVTAQVLRDTCIAWLVSQGLRFADFAQFVGRIGPDTVASFGERAQRGPRRPAAEVELPMPALRRPPAG